MQTFFQVNLDIAGIAHVPFHIPRHIYLNAANGIDDFYQCVKINLYIMINLNPQHILQLKHCRLRTIFLAADGMHCVKLHDTVSFAQKLLYIGADIHTRISRNRKQAQAFLRAVIMHDKGNIRSGAVRIYAEHCHIQLHISTQKGIQHTGFICILGNRITAKGPLSRYLMIGEAGTACQNHEYHYDRKHHLEKGFHRIEWLSSFRVFSCSAHGIPHSSVFYTSSFS